jgi:hypothetical protein
VRAALHPGSGNAGAYKLAEDLSLELGENRHHARQRPAGAVRSSASVTGTKLTLKSVNWRSVTTRSGRRSNISVAVGLMNSPA